MHVKVATFHTPAHNHIYTYMSLGTFDHCHFTWIQGVPIIADVSRSIGAFYARPQPRKKKDRSKTMRKRIAARRQNWLKQEKA